MFVCLLLDRSCKYVSLRVGGRYAKQWVEAYPDATAYACPGLAERKPEVGFTREVGAGLADESPAE